MYYTTGNNVVDAVATMNFSGNVIPHTWYKTIIRPTGKAYLLAINILSDIVYWYRPEEIRDEATGQLIGYKKRFRADALQRSYAQLSELFGCSEGQATDAVKFLEGLGVVKRDLRVVEMGSGIRMGNVMFLQLDAARLYELTYPENVDKLTEKERDDFAEKKNPDSCLENSGEGISEIIYPYQEKSRQPIGKNQDTYTKNTYTEITTENTNTENTTEITMMGAIPSIYPSSVRAVKKEKADKENTVMDLDDIYKKLVNRELMYTQAMEMTTYAFFKQEVEGHRFSMPEKRKRATDYLRLHFEYEYLKENYSYLLKDVDALISYMSDVVATGKRVKLTDATYDADTLGEAFFRLTLEDIQGVLRRYKEAAASHAIINKKNYIIAMLFHAKDDEIMDVNAWVAGI